MCAVVAAVAVLICFLQRRRKDRQYSGKEQPAASQGGKEIKQDLVLVTSASYDNRAYASSNDLKSEGLRHEIWPIEGMQSAE